MSGVFKTADVTASLRKRFCAPEWALFFEVANGTGSTIRNYADAIAINLFPSRGLRVHGFEIKVSRSDWQRELSKPEKAEAIMRYCDHWWIVAPKGIVREDELPPTWGLYELDGRGLRAVKQAPTLTAEPLSRPFFAALARRAGQADAATIREEARKIAEQQTSHHKFEVERIRKEAGERADRYENIIREIETATGVEVRRWLDAPGFAAAAGLVHRLGIVSTYGGIRGLANQMRTVVKQIDEIVPADGSEDLAA